MDKQVKFVYSRAALVMLFLIGIFSMTSCSIEDMACDPQTDTCVFILDKGQDPFFGTYLATVQFSCSGQVVVYETWSASDFNSIQEGTMDCILVQSPVWTIK